VAHERGARSLVIISEELLGRISSVSGTETEINDSKIRH
jgi:hypothetical protein